MQKKTPLTPQSRRLNRTLVNRTTMAPADFSSTGMSANRRLALSRQSVVPNSQPTVDMGKKLEPDNKDREIKHLYNKYLQSEMLLILMNRKTEAKEKIIVSQLASTVKVEDALRKNLSCLKMRQKHLESLIGLQNRLDEQLAKTTTCLSDLDEGAKDILTLLLSRLESYDVLKCENVVIPETREGMERLYEILKKCESALTSIDPMIKTKRDSLVSVNDGLKEFSKLHADVQDWSKKCAEILEQLQKLVLKEGADSLMLARSCEHPSLLE